MPPTTNNTQSAGMHPAAGTTTNKRRAKNTNTTAKNSAAKNSTKNASPNSRTPASPEKASAATVAAVLRDQIASEELAPGDWMPSETDLMTTHGVTRYQAREALGTLAGEGLITTKRGAGSRVRQSHRRRARHSDTRSLHHDADGHVHDAGAAGWELAETPATYRTTADVDMALALGVPEHTPVFVYDRLLTSTTTDEPRTSPAADQGAGGRRTDRRISHRLYLPFTTCTAAPALADNPFRAPDDLYAVLAAAGYELAWTEAVRATVPAPDDTTTLALPPGTAILTTRRSTTDNTGRVLAVEDTRRSAEETQLVYNLVPVPAPPNVAAGLLD